MENKDIAVEELTLAEIDEVSGGLYQGSGKEGDNPLV